ncbi:MAG TPA: L,D-transpeptidase family protein [Bryobacteraceae bacterium]|jgi:lipoprotein-anchoring transpeptidase ErfK/SrfK
MRATTVGAFVIYFVAAGAFAASPPERREVRGLTSAQWAEKIANAERVTRIAPGSSGPAVVRAQILLDRARFSPGQIDGKYGEDLAVSIKSYQENHGLQATGVIDPETWKLLNRDTAALTTTYTIMAADLKGPFVPIPKDVQEQAAMKWMGYESPQEELGEKFHESPQLLAEMNRGKRLDMAGERLLVPSVTRGPASRAVRVEVSKSRRTVTAFGLHDKVLAVYPATIGGEHDPLPLGNWKIVSVVHDPWFYYQPERYWNADPNEAKAKLPPGPRNPAGVVWMGLSKPHYGIHGTPDPGHIRHGESYGCIRLTNWDALDLSHMVRAGIPAVLEE